VECTREVGIKWNAENCVFGATEVSYFGYVLSDKGVNKEVTLEVDASKHGLGAVLMQEGKSVAYVSK